MKLQTSNSNIDAEKLTTKRIFRASTANSARPSKSVKRIKSLRPKRTLLSARKRVLAANASFGEL